MPKHTPPARHTTSRSAPFTPSPQSGRHGSSQSSVPVSTTEPLRGIWEAKVLWESIGTSGVPFAGDGKLSYDRLDEFNRFKSMVWTAMREKINSWSEEFQPFASHLLYLELSVLTDTIKQRKIKTRREFWELFRNDFVENKKVEKAVSEVAEGLISNIETTKDSFIRLVEFTREMKAVVLEELPRLHRSNYPANHFYLQDILRRDSRLFEMRIPLGLVLHYHFGTEVQVLKLRDWFDSWKGIYERPSDYEAACKYFREFDVERLVNELNRLLPEVDKLHYDASVDWLLPTRLMRVEELSDSGDPHHPRSQHSLGAVSQWSRKRLIYGLK